MTVQQPEPHPHAKDCRAGDPDFGPGFDLGRCVGCLVQHSAEWYEMFVQYTKEQPPMSDAETCRTNGWGVGTCLVGDEGYGPTVIEITAVGEEMILARAITENGEMVSWGEQLWTLRSRHWQTVAPVAAEARRTAAEALLAAQRTTTPDERQEALTAAHRAGRMNRVLYNAGGEVIDEIVIENVEMVHVEQMHDRQWWIAIYLPGGKRWSGFFTADSRGRMTFTEQDDEVEWDEVREHE